MARLREVLVRSRYPIAIELQAFLKDHPELFTTKTPEFDKLCLSSVATTNIIEMIFGLLRPFLTKARILAIILSLMSLSKSSGYDIT